MTQSLDNPRPTTSDGQDRAAPELSVVLATPDRYTTIRKTMRHLRAQTARGRVELVIVCPSAADLGVPAEDLGCFAGCHVVEIGPLRSVAHARVAGVRRATAPVVAFAEDHAYPEPGWADALIRAHRSQPCAAVGPVIANANPKTAMSWIQLFMTYGRFVEPLPAGVTDDIPGHNSSYKRALLAEYGDQLEEMLDAETVLHWDLRRRGHELYTEPAARTRHLNITLFSSMVRDHYNYGRLFAGARARGWPLGRKLFYILTAPLVPPRRVPGMLKQMRRCGKLKQLAVQAVPLLLIGLYARSAGEVVGYIRGAGDSKSRTLEFEFHRYRHLKKPERKDELE